MPMHKHATPVGKQEDHSGVMGDCFTSLLSEKLYLTGLR